MPITLNQDELEEFLNQERTVILCTRTKRGQPFAIPLWFVYQDGKLYVRTRPHGQTARNLRNDPRVCCVVETGETFPELKAASLLGMCTLVEDEAEQRQVADLFAAKYAAGRSATSTGSASAASPSSGRQTERAVFKVTPRKVITWDNAKIRR